MKTPVVLKDNYTIYLEFFSNHLWIHVDVRNWTAKIKKEFKEDVDTLIKLVNRPLLAFIVEDNVKLLKFAKLFKWKQKATTHAKDGKLAFIYVSHEM